MSSPFDFIMVMLILTNLGLLGMSRLQSCIQILALQGLLLGTLPLTNTQELISIRAIFLAGGSMVLKAIVFPRLLKRTLTDANVQREVEPFIGYSVSLMMGIGLLGLSFWLSSRFPLPTIITSRFVIPVALFMIMTGLFLIISRKKALTQVLGYLVLENGIYAFGVVISPEAPSLVEMGVLLDAFVAVFIMGILMFHINREFDHIDTDRLASLKDWTS